jgi:enamine deaminase RidA (YjgF/YER057c/UK114 family)
VSSPFDTIEAKELGRARGFAHGIVTPAGGRTLFVAGQTATDESGRITSDDFTEQFDRALARVLVVVREAGGRPDQIARMTVFVTSIDGYRASRPALGDIWRRRMGEHYPAMALVAVTALVDAGALVEIEATAVLS